MTFRALIADDHSLYRTGLALLLQDRLAVSEVIEASAFDHALDCLASTRGIALALFDLSMPGMGGPESLGVIKQTYPELRVAVVSGSEDRDHVLRSIAIGLNGYIPKSFSEEEIVSALRQIVDGQVYIPRFMTSAPVVHQNARDRSAGETAAAEISPDLHKLTPRQRSVLQCVLRGRSNKEVARELEIAEGTVKIHLAALFVHFGARNRTELATRAQAISR